MVATKTRSTAGSRAKTISLDKIRLDGDTQSRVELDENVIHDYAALLKSNYAFPPLLVVFDGANYWLVDGFHRRFAAVKAKVKKFKCRVITGTREDARWLSYGANLEHGLRRTNEDKKKAVKAALLHPNGAKLSDHKVAEHVGVAVATVGKYREQLASTVQIEQSPNRTGRDGRTINTSNIGKGGKPAPASNGSTAPASPPRRPEPTLATPLPPSVFEQLKALWGKADAACQTRFRLFIDGIE